MATLTNTKIKDTYQGLIKTSNNNTVSSSNQYLTDGFGNTTPLSIGINNIGIGTTSPSYKLDVSGTGRFTGDVIVPDEAYSASWDGNSEVPTKNAVYDKIQTLVLTNPITGTGTTNYLSKFTGTTSLGNSLVYDNGTNVGIGTTNPANKLTVNGDIGYTGVIGQGSIYGNTSNSSFATIRLYDPSNGYSLFNNQSYGYYFATGGGAKMTILNNGNVGIGTTSPLTKLHTDFGTLTNGDVNELVLQSKADGSTYYSSSAITGITFTNWVGGYTAGTLNRAAGIYGYNADTAERYGRYMGLSFYTSSLDASATEKMRIDHLGNVGIGTTNPSYKLDVSGTGRFTSTVTATNFILSSDERLKENIIDLKQRPLNFKWREFDWKESGEHQIGLIAQEVEETNPEFVETNAEGMKAVKYIELLVAKVAELESRIKMLEA